MKHSSTSTSFLTKKTSLTETMCLPLRHISSQLYQLFTMVCFFDYVLTRKGSFFNTCSLIDQHARIPGDGSETCPQFPTDIAIKRPDLFKRIDASFVRMYKGLHSVFEYLQDQIFQSLVLNKQDFIIKMNKSDYC